MLVVAGSVGAGAAPAAAAGRSDSDNARIITLNKPTPRVIFEDNTVALSGRLNTGNKGKILTLQRKHRNGTWTTWARATTRDDGKFTFHVRPTDPGNRVVRIFHATAKGPQISNQRWVRVKNRSLSISMNRQTYQPFGNIVVSGDVVGRNFRHALKIQRRTGGRWHTIRKVSTGKYGHFYRHLPNNVPGAWKIRVIWPGARPGNGRPADGTMEYSGAKRFTVVRALHPVVTRTTRKQLGGSYHDGCPVAASQLRNVRLNYWKFDRRHLGRGTLVVRASVVGDTKRIWRRALTVKYPFRKIIPTAHYGGDDVRAMWADDTSAFNCRKVTGDPTSVSPHSYGTAYDVNTVENPYMDVHGTWWPRNKGYKYRDRSTPRRGMLYGGSAVTKKFGAEGFFWGGRWSHPDYQHFEPKGASNATPGLTPAPTTSGPLDRTVLPAPRALGSGWTRYADPGSPEQGFTGNGSFAHARDTSQVAAEVLPLGCADRPQVSLPRVTAALQGTYRSRSGHSAQVVVMQFASADAASQYFAALGTTLRACRVPDGRSGVSVDVTAEQPGFRTARRTLGDGTTWTETDVRHGDRVAVLLADGPVGGSVGGSVQMRRALAGPLR